MSVHRDFAGQHQALSLRPDLPEAHRKRAELLAALGRESEAIEALHQTVRLNPSLDELRAALLMALIQRKMETDAVTMANEWFALHPQDVGLRSRVADMFVAGGMPDRVKCVHALDAHSLAAGPGVNPVGDAALARLDRWWSAGVCARPEREP